MAKTGFKGKLARVNMWSRMLDIRTEIPKQVSGGGFGSSGVLVRQCKVKTTGRKWSPLCVYYLLNFNGTL